MWQGAVLDVLGQLVDESARLEWNPHSSDQAMQANLQDIAEVRVRIRAHTEPTVWPLVSYTAMQLTPPHGAGRHFTPAHTIPRRDAVTRLLTTDR